MLNPGPHLGDDPINVVVDGVQFAALRRLAHHAPELARAGERRLPRSVDIAFVGPNRCLIAVQKFIPDLAVMHLRGRDLEAMHDATLRIDAKGDRAAGGQPADTCRAPARSAAAWLLHS